MKRIFLPLFIGIVSALLFITYKVSQVPLAPVHYHANFAIFEDNKQVDFTSPQFMHISPCSDTDHHSDDPKENVHLHDEIGNVVHLHDDGITWKTLFETLGYWERLEQSQEMAKLAENYTFDVRVNGERVETDVLTRPIVDQEQLLIHVGSASGDLEKELKTVGSNAKEYDEGKIGVEKCGSPGNRNFWQRLKIAFGL